MANAVRRFLAERPGQKSEARYEDWREDLLKDGGWAPSAKDVRKVLGPWSSVLRIAVDGADFTLVSPRLRTTV